MAIFGIGDIVFDPSNYQEAVRQLVQLERQYAKLVETYQMARTQYEHLVRMSQKVPVNMAARYRALVTPWGKSSATNTYGTTAGWIAAINTGMAVADGYRTAIEELLAYGPSFRNIPAGQAERVKTQYATVELTDGANVAALETLGRMRGNAPAVELAIQNLEEDSLSADPAMNTEIAVLNKINAANLIAVRNTQDANKLLAALTEERLIESKRRRDAEARAINQHVRFMADGKAALESQAAGASSAMLNWRMP
jgi:hypothetical protein